ncbi:MAG TPA: S9 family peptidase [Longimicrobiales bacterium]
MKLTPAILCLALVGTSIAPATAQKRPLTPEDLYRLKTASDVTVSPDGRWVVFVLTSIDSAGNRYVRDLYGARTGGGAPRRLTWTPQSNEALPVFSPDGRFVAFVARREGDERAAEIYVLPFTEPGEARRITKIMRGVSRPVWSPDGRRIAFTVSDSLPRDTATTKENKTRAQRLEAAARRNDPRVINRLNYIGEQAFSEERWNQIYVVDALAENAQAQRITSGSFGNATPAWTPDGKSLVYAAAPPKGNYHADYEQDADLYIVAADGRGAPRNLTPGGATGLSAAVAGRAGARTTAGDVYTERNPRISPDGKWLAYARNRLGEHVTAANTELIVAEANGANPVCVNCTLDRDMQNYNWDQQGRLYFTVTDRGGVHLYRSSQPNRPPQPLLTGPRGVLSFDVNGSTIAWAEMSPELPSDVYAADLDGKQRRRLTTLNDSLLATVHVQPYEELWYKAPDGYPVQGWIVRPPGGATSATPLAVEMHGGPHVMWGPGEATMWLEYQSLAGAGYTVFFSNPRGSAGYGFEHKKAIHRNWGNLPMGDVLAGADTVLARGLADANKQVITGGSYAGYLTAWIIGHTTRFKAAVAQRGVYDMVSWWGMATTWRLYESEFASVPWEDPELAWKNSPIAYVDKIQTPLLLLHGEQDYRVGLGGVQTLFRMLKAQGKDTELVLYPREGHEVTRSGEPHHRVDHMSRIIEWFDRYLQRGVHAQR